MSRPRQPLVSHSPELLWPAVASPDAAQLLALLYQLEQSQFWPAATLERAQHLQLARLLAHARAKSPYYAQRAHAQQLENLPLLTRYELLTEADSIRCRELGPEHGDETLVQTSGSTGQLVAVRRTGASRTMLFALGLRFSHWHELDFQQTLAVIRADSPHMDDDERARKLGWGKPATLLYRTGPGYALPIATDIAQQAAWLQRRKPGYLLTYPTNLAALLDAFAAGGGAPPGLLAVRSMGETLPPALRKRCREVWGAPVIDVYSAQEVGIIASECPESGLYHVQSESLIVEVLDDTGRRCDAGQVGRVVVTDLHNFAMPLIRYVIGDRAEVGPTCPCGRGLPTLSRVLGRERNLVVLPNGQRHWPLLGLHEYRKIAPIVQYQAVQHSTELVELRLVVEAGQRLNESQEQELRAVVQRALGHPFEIRLQYFEGELARGAGGKLEEFMSLVS